ncbi:hypothetical protein ACSX1A_04165 [Pontibacter sp. MBLB2868]|uniref:hypothetical protein n=1 Tax=Pontibacter sp. MBLB2868 TaxID=3451555 RepID=UPI003F754886
MKKIILLLFAVSLSTLSQAQRMKVTDEPLDTHVLAMNLDGPAMATKELLKELNLDEQQYRQVQLLNDKRYQQMEEADILYKDNAIQRSKAIYAINQEIDKAVTLMLKPEQMRLYLKLENRQSDRYASESDK